MVQINNTFSGQDYLPLSVGYLQAYAQQYLPVPDDYKFLVPVFQRIPVDEAVEQLLDADLVGFSLYCWNKNLSLEIARCLKARRPEIVIICGGPQVPDNSEEFLRCHDWINLVCHGEGEKAFTAVLGSFATRDWSTIPSVSYIHSSIYYRNPCSPRLTEQEFAEIPSPYLTGIFDKLMMAYAGHEWLGMWETNRGCPFQCQYCDWGSLTANKVYKFPQDRLFAELEWFARNKIEFLFCCDANFGIFDRDIEIARYAGIVKERFGYPRALSVQNAKNAKERVYRVQKALADGGLNKGVTLALESVNPETLKAIKRDNIRWEDFRSLQKRFAKDGIDTYTDFIIALPCETYDSFADGISMTIEHGQHNRIQFGNLSNLPNAPMADPAYTQKYGLLLREVEMVIYHGSIETNPDRIPESVDLVVATETMPSEEWVRTRVFCWMVALLHFDKIFQIPFVVLHEITGVSYRKLIEVFTDGLLVEYPIIAEIRTFFQEKARSIQCGGIEQCPAPEWLNLYWPPDEYVFIRLCRESKLSDFYCDAERALIDFCQINGIEIPRLLLKDAIKLNRQLIKQPFMTNDLSVTCSYNVLEFYRAAIRLEKIPLERGAHTYLIDRTSETWSSWDEWYKNVVWYGNKKGAYLYGNYSVGGEIEGHF